MLVTGNFHRLAVESKQVDDLVDVVRYQTRIGVDGTRFSWKS